MEFVWTVFSYVFWLIGSVISWLLVQLVWIVLWLLLPIAAAAFIATRVAGLVFGKDVVARWLKQLTRRWAAGAGTRLRRTTLVLTAMPLRVVAFLMIYGLWHSVVSLVWTPRWSPWSRAWALRRRRPTTITQRSRAPAVRP